MALTGSQQAYTWARSGAARSGATRSAYVMAWTTVDLITRDPAGNIIGRVDLVPYIRAGSLTVTQALNDEPDTCAFTIVPTAPPEAVPAVGQEVSVQWTPGLVEFRGYCLVIQFDRRVKNQSPWVSVQCQDAMWRFDARLVTYRFPAQSVTASIAELVTWFTNTPAAPAASDFTLTHVQPAMPAIASFDVVNQRPSTVLRTLTAAVGGAFYVDGNDLHAWAGSLTEPGQTAPQPLTDDLPSLKSFRVTHDATQLRKRVLVEGRRASTLIPYPTLPATNGPGMFLGLPVNDATIFAPTTGPDARYVARIGSQWVYVNDPQVVTPTGANPPQTRTVAPFTPGQTRLRIPILTPSPPSRGWIRVAGQFSMYRSIAPYDDVSVELILPAPTFPYGIFTGPIPTGETVDWVDSVLQFEAHGLAWTSTTNAPTPGDLVVRAHPVDTPVVTLAEAERPLAGWPALEGFVQDGRYSYTGALARANADLDAFAEPLVVAEWDTDDLNAAPGRPQVIALSQTAMRDPFTTSTVTITHVDITFPLRTLPPRRHCVGGDVKPSTFLDLVLTDES